MVQGYTQKGKGKVHTPLTGIHHVTAMVDDPQQNVDFYAEVLGLRLIKQTVNFDDPSTYHLYFGDETGRPGTILTFFPWSFLPRGVRGSGEISAFALAIPAGAAAYWAERLTSLGIPFADPAPRFGQPVIRFEDPAGLSLELVEQPGVEQQPVWQGGGVPAEYAIRQVAAITITVARPEPTAALLTEVLGFRQVGSEGDRTRYATGDDVSGALVDVVSRSDLPRVRMGAGSVHHIAWRVADDTQQQAWQHHLLAHNVNVTPVRDRQYFHSIYFREPGGTLFEIATDTPGFAIDETPEHLGTMLKLPPWLESQRTAIQERLPALTLPTLAPKGV
jgi:glyoxalase family protein